MIGTIGTAPQIALTDASTAANTSGLSGDAGLGTAVSIGVRCTDESLIGSDFYVMERLEGTIPRRHLGFDSTPDDLRRVRVRVNWTQHANPYSLTQTTLLTTPA